MIYRYVLLSFVLLATAACSTRNTDEKNEVEAIDGINEIVLKVDQKKQVGDAVVHFMQVSDDNRCPKGVKCSVKGSAQAVFLIEQGDSVETLTLNTANEGDNSNSVGLTGNQVLLARLTPSRKKNVAVDPKSYQAQLLIFNEKIVADRDVVIIDVRSEQEFKAGHYNGALNLAHDNIKANIDAYNLPKEQLVFLYCRSGRRASIAQKVLQDLGFLNVINAVNQNTVSKILNND